MSEYLIPITIITILVLLNGLFVAAEFAIIGVRPTRLTQLAEEGNTTAAEIKAILDDPVSQDRYIATAQLGITIASLGLGMYGEHAIAEWLLWPLEHWFGLGESAAHTLAVLGSLALLTFAHVVVGEMVPKSLALQYAERTALAIAGIMNVIRRLFMPAVLVLNAIGNGMLRMVGIPPAETHNRLYSSEELELLVSESHEGGLLSDNEQQLIQNIFDFSERRAGQVMTPRPRVAAIPITMGEAELRRFMATSPFSRFPVYERDLDHVVGMLLLKDFVSQQLRGVPFNLRELLRHIPAVPESVPVEQLLAAFKRSHVHMALVIDEYGGTAGIVSLEDLVEEVVGEVHDEFDLAETPPLREVSPGVLMARGDLLLDDFFDTVEAATSPDEAEMPDVETVGGLVVGLLGRPPRVGDEVALDGLRFTVESINGLAVTAVRIILAPSVKDDQTESANSSH